MDFLDKFPQGGQMTDSPSHFSYPPLATAVVFLGWMNTAMLVVTKLSTKDVTLDSIAWIRCASGDACFYISKGDNGRDWVTGVFSCASSDMHQMKICVHTCYIWICFSEGASGQDRTGGDRLGTRAYSRTAHRSSIYCLSLHCFHTHVNTKTNLNI